MLRQFPGSASFASGPFQRAYDELENQLAVAVTPASLAGLTNLATLLELLEAGTLHRELGARTGLPRPVSWENTRLPLVAQRLTQVAEAGRGWRELDQAIRLLMNAADRASLANDQTLRRAYLQQTVSSLTTARVVARALLQNATGAIRAADMALPGDIFIDQPAGYATYNRESGEFHGAVRGKLRLPKHSLSLTVPNAAFDNDGRFDVTAFGQLNFDGGQLAIPARQPLQIWNGRERGVALEGGARLTLANGMRFDASVSLVDPRYSFALSARGLELDLGHELILRRPTLSAPALNALEDSARDALGDYLKNLNGSLETLANAAGSFPPVDETGFGRPPEFAAPEITFDFSPLNAWSAQIIALTRAGLTNAQQNLDSVLQSIDHLNQDARAATNALSDGISQLANLAARSGARRQMKQAIDEVARQQLAGSDSVSAVNQKLREGARVEGTNLVALLTPDLPDRLADSLDAVRSLYEHVGMLQDLGEGTGAEGVIPANPCAAYTNAAASLRQRAAALAVCAARRQAGRMGLAPETGAVADTNRFKGLTEYDLALNGRLLLSLDALLAEQGEDNEGELQKLVAPVLLRQQDLLIQEFTDSPGMSLTRYFEASRLLWDNAVALQLTGTADPRSSEVVALLAAKAPRGTAIGSEMDQAKKEAEERIGRRNRQLRSAVDRAIGSDRRVQIVSPDENYQPDFLTQLNNYFQVIGRPVPLEISTNMDAYVRFKVQELRARPFTAAFLTNRLAEAQGLFSAVIGLTDWAGFRMTNDFSVLTNLQTTFSEFSVNLSTVAEAQKAWWLLGRYDEALRLHAATYGTNLNVGLNNAFTQARNGTLLAANRVADALLTLANNVRLEDVVVPLPGAVDIERVSGRLFFNRDTGFLEGCFGGRVRFPEVNTNLFFEIGNACLANDGSYSIDAGMGTPLPFGQAKLRTSLAITGGSSGVATFGGAGTLTVPNAPSGDRVFDVSLNYNQAERRLGFDAQGNNLDLRLSEDFVLFNAGVGFDLRAGSAQGTIRVSGSAGLLAKQKPLPAVIGPTNFNLSVIGLTTAVTSGSNSFSLSLSNGTFRLPEIFHNGLCATNPGQIATGPEIALVSTNPVIVSIDSGTTQKTTFSGALDFRNVGFNVPGLTNLGVEICSARLALRSNDVPVLENLSATLSVPFPNQTSVFDVTGADWAIDGFPAAASVTLRQGTRLLDLGGFTLDFQTNSTLAFNTSLSADGRRNTIFTASGGMRGAFSPDLLADPQSNSGFSFGTGGSLRWETGGLPQVALDSLSFGGRMKIGGAGGIELAGVDTNGIPAPGDPNVQASITLNGLTNLLALSAERKFEVSVSGAIGATDFMFFGLRDARLVFNGVATVEDPEPQFQVSSIGFQTNERLKLLGLDALPLHLTAGSVTFITPGVPLPRLLSPTNLILTVSGNVDISLAPPDAKSDKLPRLFGAVTNVQVRLPRGFGAAPEFSVNGFALALENLTIGDMAGFSGGLAVNNLNNPSELFFAGTVGGMYNGVGIKATIATRLDGLIGLCLAANAGPAGIPLDGGALGGILLTGAEGGVSFLNNFSDPCDFVCALGLCENSASPASAASGLRTASVRGPKVSDLAVLSWSDLQRFQELHENRKAAIALAARGRTIRPLATPALDSTTQDPCPTGDCPPATLNLLCQRHPSAAEEPSPSNYNGKYRDRTIFKFSSLDRNAVDQILAAANINLSGSAPVVADNFADGVREFIDGLIPRPPAS
ncbi:MAG TPA: hypothetical protein VHH73_17905, partial [Verrucomicrobiae bacterium]|nr:hypothetical protein [Verrucomicrobiae bacterium]